MSGDVLVVLCPLRLYIGEVLECQHSAYPLDSEGQDPKAGLLAYMTVENTREVLYQDRQREFLFVMW